jgi:hypothetical protein
MKQHEEGCPQPGPDEYKVVVVHVKLSARDRNALKAVLSLEGTTMQDYFATKAAEKIASGFGKA